MASLSAQQLLQQAAADAEAAAAEAARQAEIEAEKERKRAELLVNHNNAIALRDSNEEYYNTSLNAIYQLETAANGINFMNNKQKTNIQGKLESGIDPNSTLLENLGLDDNGTCLTTITDALDLLNNKKNSYKNLYEFYDGEATRYYSEYLLV